MIARTRQLVALINKQLCLVYYCIFTGICYFCCVYSHFTCCFIQLYLSLLNNGVPVQYYTFSSKSSFSVNSLLFSFLLLSSVCCFFFFFLKDRVTSEEKENGETEKKSKRKQKRGREKIRKWPN